MTTLETERLTLRMPRLEDFDHYAAMWAEPEVTQFVAVDGKPMSRFAAWQSMAAQVGHWHLRGFGMFTIIERGTGAFVGRVGPWHPEGWPGLEVGWSLKRRYCGCGYATESARRCISHAFNELNQDRIISFILPQNLRSIRLAERLGERMECEVTLPHLPADRKVLQYGLSRRDWTLKQST